MLQSKKSLALMISVFSLIFVLSPLANADLKAAEKPTVAVFVDYPQEYLRGQESAKLLNDKAETLFPAAEYNLLPLDLVQTEMRAYREEKEITHTDYYYKKWLVEGQVAEIAQKLNCDYVLYLRFENGDFAKSEFFINSAKLSLTCNIAWFDIREGKYVSGIQILKGMDYKDNDTDTNYTLILDKVLTSVTKDTFMQE